MQQITLTKQNIIMKNLILSSIVMLLLLSTSNTQAQNSTLFKPKNFFEVRDEILKWKTALQQQFKASSQTY